MPSPGDRDLKEPSDSGAGGPLQVDLDWLEAERLCVRVDGELDLATAGALEERLVEALEASRHVVLDLAEVGFIDSTGLAAIIEAVNRADGAGAVLEIATPLPSQAQRLFELTGIESRLSFTAAPPPRGTS